MFTFLPPIYWEGGNILIFLIINIREYSNMSAMDYYRSNLLLDRLCDDTKEINVSTEVFSAKGVLDTVKKIFEKIKQFVTWVGKKVIDGFKYILKLFKKGQKKDKLIFKTLIKEDLYKVYKDTLIGPNGRTKFFINQDGSIIDLDKMEEEYGELYKDVSDANLNESSRLFDPQYIRQKVDRVDFGYLVENYQDLKIVKIDQLVKLINPDNINNIQKHVENLPKLVSELQNDSEELYKEYINKKHTDSTDDKQLENVKILRASKKAESLMEIVKCKFQIYQAILGFYRIVSTKLRTGFCFCEKVEKGTQLYHLSFNDKLVEDNSGILEPRYPLSANFKAVDSVEIFPKRTSFSSKIEEAVYGIWGQVAKHVEQDPNDDNVITVNIHVYEGIVDDNTTRIKEKYVEENVYEYHQTKEIPITSKIKIKYGGEYKLYFDKRKRLRVKLPNGKTDNNGFAFIRKEKIK